jgi:hypothetical protein
VYEDLGGLIELVLILGLFEDLEEVNGLAVPVQYPLELQVLSPSQS